MILGLSGTIEILLVYRAWQMRALAKRLNWTYTAGNNHIWKLIFKHKVYPHDFWFCGFRMDAMWGTMNIIEGHCKGIRLVALDSLFHFGPKSERYVTFIGAKAETDPFLLRYGREKVAHSKGWFVLFRTRFSLLTWSLSTNRIEAHLCAICDC